LKPRWLTAAIKSGKKVDDFLITGSAALKANGRKKSEGATAKAKRAQAEVCPICDFQTTPPHEGGHLNPRRPLSWPTAIPARDIDPGIDRGGDNLFRRS
jgi:hypothetical protein